MGEIYTGVVDRFEEGQAVILLESEGEVIDEVIVATEDLPEEGRHDDAVLQIDVKEGEIESIEFDEEETENRKQRTKSRFESLSQRPPSSESDSN